MATFTNQSKNSATYTNQSKNSAAYTNQGGAGRPWQYNQSGITYNGPTDTITGQLLYYDLEGIGIVFTNQSKNSATFTNQSKNSATFTNQTKH